MISQNLKEFVAGNRRLVIPNIGSFIKRYDDDGKEKLIFSSFLKQDDGVLKSLLCDKEKISLDDAAFAVGKFAESIYNTTNEGKIFAIENFGYFIKNKGVISFVIDDNPIKREAPIEKIIQRKVEEKPQQVPSQNQQQQSATEQQQQSQQLNNQQEKQPDEELTLEQRLQRIQQRQQQIQQQPQQQTNETQQAQQPSSQQEKQPTEELTLEQRLQRIQQRQQQFQQKQPQQQNNEAQQPLTQTPPVTQQTQQPKIVDARTIPAATPKKEVKYTKPYERKIEQKSNSSGKTAAIWILSILLFLLLAFILVYFFNRDIKQKVDSFVFGATPAAVEQPKNKKQQKPVIAPKDSIALSDTAKNNIQDTVKTQQSVTTENVQNQKLSVDGADKKYQIVVGYFYRLSEVETFKDELSQKGLSIKVLTRKGGNGSTTYTAVFGETDDKDEALQIQKASQEQGFKDAWIKTNK